MLLSKAQPRGNVSPEKFAYGYKGNDIQIEIFL